MRKFIILILIFLVSTVAHWAFAAAGAGFGANINFMLAAGAAVCSFYERRAGYAFMFCCGIFLDFFGVNMFGAYALAFTFCAAAVYLVKESLDFEYAVPQAVLVFCLTLFCVLVYNLAGVIFEKSVSWNGARSLIFGAVINALISPVIFYALKKLQLAAPGKSIK